MKITLINPPQSGRYPQPPMGLAQLAAVAERAGHQVTILDINALGAASPALSSLAAGADVIGLTAMTPTIGTTISLARELKKANPDIPIILGGPHATLLPEETLKSAPEIDIIVRGEGENVLLDLLPVLGDSGALSRVAGISYRRDGKILSNPPADKTTDLDDLPFLAYHLLPAKRYRPHPPHGRALPFAAIITSRGCPYHCSYCSKPVSGYKFRGQSPERVLGEIEYLIKRFGIKELAFYDDVFTLDKKRAGAIAEGIISRGLKLDWTCETRVNLVDPELLRLLKKAGCYAIAYGIESASPEILATIDKNISLEQVASAIAITREAGLQTIGYFMIGSPGETPRTIQETIDFARKLKLDFAQFAITTPFPGTELYRRYLKDHGHETAVWENFIYAGGGRRLAPVFESEHLKRDDLQDWAKKAYRDFYLRPSYLWQRLKSIRSAGDLLLDLRGINILISSLRA